MKIDGKQIALEIFEELKIRVEKLKDLRGITPTLAVILIGNDASSIAYIKQKELKAKEIGAQIKIYKFDEDVLEAKIEALIKNLDANNKIHGIILQRPAPKQINADKLVKFISPKKEVDGFGIDSPYDVPVAKAVFVMLEKVFDNLNERGNFLYWLKTKDIVVLGKGETAGMPIINAFDNSMIEIEVIDSKTENKEELIKNADILISAIGKINIIDTNLLKTGVILIGIGISVNDEGKTRGDYDIEKFSEIASFYSPTPGGVGPVNVASLMQNLVEAAEIQSA
jgi:methylenetetrahydrofolate dehydrogenase (NADP+)/methenyltetrahydrofolate cyclohydrolase